MDADTLRQAITDRLVSLGLTPYRAANLAGLPDQTVRDYLGGRDLQTAAALRLAAAIGLAVTARPVPRFDPGPAPSRGRKKNPEKSG
jgi:hypothetical protein